MITTITPEWRIVTKRFVGHEHAEMHHWLLLSFADGALVDIYAEADEELDGPLSLEMWSTAVKSASLGSDAEPELHAPVVADTQTRLDVRVMHARVVNVAHTSTPPAFSGGAGVETPNRGSIRQRIVLLDVVRSQDTLLLGWVLRHRCPELPHTLAALITNHMEDTVAITARIRRYARHPGFYKAFNSRWHQCRVRSTVRVGAAAASMAAHPVHHPATRLNDCRPADGVDSLSAGEMEAFAGFPTPFESSWPRVFLHLATRLV